MGMQSKRRRMNNSSFGGHNQNGNNDFMNGGNQDNSGNNQMAFTKSMSMQQPEQQNQMQFAQPDLTGQQSTNTMQ